jgi:hypothetical protein
MGVYRRCHAQACPGFKRRRRHVAQEAVSSLASAGNSEAFLAVVPEPAWLAFLALGGLVLRRRGGA